MTSPAKDWDALYRANDTGWDLRGITPPLQALLDRGYLKTLGLPQRFERVIQPGERLPSFARERRHAPHHDVIGRGRDPA